MTKYGFRDTPYLFRNADKADPQKVGEALAGIAAENKGRLNPADVVEAARQRRSELHAFFTWDDAEAAEAHRLDQARAIIRAVIVVEVSAPNDNRKRAYLSICDDQGYSYRPVKEIENDAGLQLKLMDMALRELRAFQQRFADLQDICAMVKVVEDTVRSRMDAEATASI
jgi:hypothetical protein